MFDSYTKQGDKHITINQQPNDAADAARLYGEIQKKAEEEWKGAKIVEVGAGMRVLAREIETEQDFDSLRYYIRVLFAINRETYDLRIVVPDGGLARSKEALWEAIGKEVAGQVMMMLAAGKKKWTNT